jgi:thioredoxin-dependent peroxiredoxin
MKVEIGEKVPAFQLKNQEAETVKLSDFKGKKIILYFYPKDDTPGCTKEACAFRDSHKQFVKKDVVILGVSPDDQKQHVKFIEKYDLPFTLLSDVDREVANIFGVYKEKNMYGKKVMGIERSTFLIDEKGVLIKEMRKVKVEGHIEEVLKLIE